MLGSFFTSASAFALPRVLSCVVTSTSATVETSARSFASAYTSTRVSKLSWLPRLLAWQPAFRPVLLTLSSFSLIVVTSPSCSVPAIVLAKALHYLFCCLVSWAVKRVHQVLGLHIAQCVTKCLDFHTTCVLSSASAILAPSESASTSKIVSASVWTNALESTSLSLPPSAPASFSARVLAGVFTSASASLVF